MDSVTRALRLVPETDDDPSRHVILDGALDAFVDLGVRRTSMGDIARRVRVSPATLYRKFATKSGLVEAVTVREVRRFLADMDDVVEAARDEGADAELQLATLAFATLDFIRRNRLLARLLKTEPELILPILTVQASPVIALGRDHMAGILARMQAEGVLGEFDPLPIAEVLARLAVSMVLTPSTVLPVTDPEAVRQLLRLHVGPGLGLLPAPDRT